jgi:hypothetical protein
MDFKYIPVLADALRTYFDGGECEELCDAYGVRLEWRRDAYDFMGLSKG